jgi:signal transduction histidine kinase
MNALDEVFPLHVVVDDLPDAVAAFAAARDAAGMINEFERTYANHAAVACELLGGSGVGALFDVCKRVVDSGEAYEHPSLWFGERAFDVRITKSGDGCVVVAREVTEDLIVSELRELALQEERSLSQQLRDLDASRAALIAAVTHDLRTPLTGIVGLSWLLENDWDEMDEATRREYVRDIVRSGEDLDRRITSVLEHLKIESGRYEVELEMLDVGEELAGAIDRMTLMLEPYRVVFDVPEDTAVWADRTGFARVAENLLSNAVKYAPTGTTVTVRAAEEGEAVVVSVIDEGPGISEADAQRVFEQFERLESGRRVAHGNGVGLSAVRQLVELMDGRVWVDPNPDRGSAFRFALPKAAAIR